MILTIDEVYEILDELAEKLPPGIFEGLTGGVNLLEEERHPKGDFGGELLLLGEYVVAPIGRWVNIYYGSFLKRFRDEPREKWVRQLRQTLHHELTHHLEHRAGCRDLEREDEREMQEFLSRREGKTEQ